MNPIEKALVTADKVTRANAELERMGRKQPEMFEVVAEIGADEWDDDYADDECEGHESLAGSHMGETVYCDGTCRI